jgi:surfactin synthase thioesterase subunit
VVANDDLRDLLLPGVQADFRLVASYRYVAAAPLPVGITLVNGEDDAHIGPTALDGWADETTVGVARHWSPGGHFYFEDHPHAIANVLREVLTTTSGHAELTI